jgi:hypothetical protein
MGKHRSADAASSGQIVAVSPLAGIKLSPNAVAVLHLSGYICAECIPEVVRYLRSRMRREHRVE